MEAFRKPRISAALSLFAAVLATAAFALSCASSAPAQGRQPGSASSAPGPAVDVSRYRNDTGEWVAMSVPADIADRVAAKPSSGLPKLVAYLLEGESDPYMKAKILHDWEAVHIRYDVPDYYSHRIPDQSVNAVLARGNAVCEGYARLYKALCDLGGIECAYVPGVAGSSDFYAGKRNAGHAWNALRIGGVWRLVDVTWDSSYVKSPSDYGLRYQTAYFLLDPEFMIYTHFPDSPDMQLLDRPLSLAEFNSLPHADGEFLSLTRRAPVGISPTYKSEGLSTLSIPHAPGVQLEAMLTKEDIFNWSDEQLLEAPTLPVSEGEEASTFTIPFPAAGDYTLTAFVRIGDGVSSWVSKGVFQVPFHSSGACRRSFASIDAGFQKLAGLPKEGAVFDESAGPEFRLSFPAPPGVILDAWIGTAKPFGKGGLGFTPIPESRRHCSVRRGEEGIDVKVAFPGPGTYTLSMTATGPHGLFAATMLELKPEAGLGRNYFSLDPELVEVAGEPSLRAPDGTPLGEPDSDIVGKRLDLLFPKADDGLTADLYEPRPDGKILENEKKYSRYICNVSSRRTSEGLLFSVQFPKPGDYEIIFREKGPRAKEAFGMDGLYLTSR